jgi:hypothetical protein
MDKIYGTTVRQDGLYKVGRRAYMLFYGLYTDDKGSTYEYRHSFDHKPTWDEVKAVLIETINAQTKEKILNGFTWNDMKVWLSEDNQRNFMMINNYGVYPLQMKINEAEDGSPIYHTFADANEFNDFSKLASQYVIETLYQGWTEKDQLDAATFGF